MNIDPQILKRMRSCVGWNQHDLAYATRIPRWTLAFFEAGDRSLTAEERRKIVTAILAQAETNVNWLREQFAE